MKWLNDVFNLVHLLSKKDDHMPFLGAKSLDSIIVKIHLLRFVGFTCECYLAAVAVR